MPGPITRRRVLLLPLAALAGCGTGQARIKGRVTENGQPLSLPKGTQAAIAFTQLGSDGSSAGGKMYTAMMAEDGAFELVASGGSVAPGQYQLSLDIGLPGKAGEKFKPFAGSRSPIRRELKTGNNDLTIDLTNPNG